MFTFLVLSDPGVWRSNAITTAAPWHVPTDKALLYESFDIDFIEVVYIEPT